MAKKEHEYKMDIVLKGLDEALDKLAEFYVDKLLNTNVQDIKKKDV